MIDDFIEACPLATVTIKGYSTGIDADNLTRFGLNDGRKDM